MTKENSVKVTYYLSRTEYDNIRVMAHYLYDQKGISRPTVGTYSNAASLKVYQDIYNRLTARQRKELADKYGQYVNRRERP